MRARMVLCVVAVVVGAGIAAQAEGPSGSTEDQFGHADCKFTGQGVVMRRGGVGFGGSSGTVFVGPDGVEGCSDDNAGLDGRWMVSTRDGGYAAADGEPSSPAPLRRWQRVDKNGLSCGSGDATTQSSKGTCP